MRATVPLWEIFEPHAKQWQFLATTARFNLFLAGMGSGKTWSLCLKALMLALQNPGVPGVLAGRVYPDVRDTLEPEIYGLNDAIHKATGVNLIVRHSKSDGVLHMLNGAQIWLRSYDKPQRLLGRNLGWACLDELEFSVAPADQVLDVVNSRVRHKAATLRQIAIATSPNGLSPLVQKFREAQGRGDASYCLTTCKTTDNPHLPPDFLDGLRSQMSERAYRQNVLGEILRPQDVVFPEFDERSHVVAHLRDRSNPVVLGVDWGTNHAAAVLIEVDQHSGVWTVFAELVAEGVNRDKWRGMLIDWLESHRLFARKTGATDRLVLAGTDRAVPRENAWLNGTLQRTAIRWARSKAQQWKANQIEMVRTMLEPATGQPRLMFAETLSRDERGDTWPLIPSIQRYHYRRRLDGQLDAMPVKDDKTDHIIDALCYAILAGWADPALHGGISRPHESSWQHYHRMAPQDGDRPR